MQGYLWFIGKRALQLLAVVFFGVSATFLVTHLSPVSPVESALGRMTARSNSAPEAVQAMREALSDEVDVESLPLTDDGLSFRRPGIGPDVPARLRRGQWALQAEVDLHGLTREVAREALVAFVREAHRERFKPSIDWRKCKFAWYGTDLELEAFTFVFKDTEHGLFQVHAYPFAPGLSTWIVECREDVWKRAQLDEADEPATVAYMERLFADDLDGHRLLTNRSLWRTFPTNKNETWHHGNVVLIGDSAHTAHFSIGSGTKLALEDSIALVGAFAKIGLGDVPRALAAYEDERFVDTIKTQ